MSRVKTSKSSLLKLISGTGVSQIIVFLVTPILTGIYSPSEFGQYEVFFSVVNILIVFSTLQYDKALIIPTTRIEYLSLLKGVLLILFGFSILVSIVFFLFEGFILEISSMGVLNGVLWLVPIVIILRSFNLILVTNLNREGGFSVISLEKVTRSISNSGLGIWFGKGIFTKTGLIMAELFSGMISLVYLLVKLKKRVVLILFRKWKQLDTLGALKKYQHFSIYGLPKSIFFSLTGNVPIIIITYYYGIVEAGIYGLAVRLLSKPVTLLANTSATLFKRDVMLELQESKSTINSVYRTLKIQMLVTVLPFIAGFLLIDWVFELAFPLEWQGAIDVIKLLSVMYFFNTLISPITYVFMVYKKQNVDLILNILLFVVSISAMILVNIWFESFNLSILAYSVSYSVFYIIFLVYSIVLAKRNEIYY